MLTDRELLELAAKAYGIELILWHEKYSGGWLDGCGAPSTWWSPLADDGDALRLAVKLRITPNIDSNITDCEGCTESHFSDPCAATRRAIVRAAAEIGKAMESKC